MAAKKKKVVSKKVVSKSPKKVTKSAPAVRAPAKAQVTALAILPKPSGTLTADALAVQKTIRELGAQVALLNISDEPTANTAAVMLTQLKAIRERWDRERLKLTKPLKEQAKSIEAKFRPTTEQLEAFDGQLRQKYLKYRSDVDAAQAEARTKLLAQAETAAAEGDTESASALAEQSMAIESAAKTSMVDTGSVQTKKVWTFKVTDLGLVPEEYKTLDESKVRAAIRSGMRDAKNEAGEVTQPAIPGIVIFEEASLAVSAAGLLMNVLKDESQGDVSSLPS